MFGIESASNLLMKKYAAVKAKAEGSFLIDTRRENSVY